MIDWILLILGNARRTPARGLMTVSAVAISLVAFALVRIVIANWTDQIRQTPDNRVVTRNSIGWQVALPVSYVQTVRELDGVRRVLGGRHGRLSMPFDKVVEFESYAVDAEPFIEMLHELVAPPEQKREFVATRRAAFVSEELATEYGWTVGKELHFRSRSLPGEDVILTLAGIFRSTRKGFARRAVYFHWELLNERLPEHERDKVNLIVAEIEDPQQGARLARLIDMRFAQSPQHTLSQEDQAMNAQLVGQYAGILDALGIVSVLILGIVLLIIGNTLGMTLRERSKEYATLRALGFRRKHVLAIVLGEATALGLVSGLVGLALAYPLISGLANAYLGGALGLAKLQVSSGFGLLIVVLGATLGFLSALVPAHQLAKAQIVDALRRVG